MRTMIAPVAALFAVTMLLAACGGSDPMAQAIKHQEAMLDLLEKNKDNPEAAGNAVEEYAAKNKAELDKLKEESSKMEERFAKDPEGAAKAMLKHMEKIQKLSERAMKLMTENPELMSNEKVSAAMNMLN